MTPLHVMYVPEDLARDRRHELLEEAAGWDRRAADEPPGSDRRRMFRAAASYARIEAEEWGT